MQWAINVLPMDLWKALKLGDTMPGPEGTQVPSAPPYPSITETFSMVNKTLRYLEASMESWPWVPPELVSVCISSHVLSYHECSPSMCMYLCLYMCVCVCVCVCVCQISFSLFLFFFLSPSLQTFDLSSHTLIQTSSSGRHVSAYDHRERIRGEIEESGHLSGASML
jgi:hypothetical protein